MTYKGEVIGIVPLLVYDVRGPGLTSPFHFLRHALASFILQIYILSKESSRKVTLKSPS